MSKCEICRQDEVELREAQIDRDVFERVAAEAKRIANEALAKLREAEKERDLARAQLATLMPAVGQETGRIRELEAQNSELREAIISYLMAHDYDAEGHFKHALGPDCGKDK